MKSSWWIGLAASVSLSLTAAAQLAVVFSDPALNATNVPPASAIHVRFNAVLDPASVTSANVWVFGRVTGTVPGVLSLGDGGASITFTPSNPLMAGEQAWVYISHNLRAADGAFLRAGGYTIAFTTAARATPADFQHLATFSDRSPNNAQTRIYGGLALDLNRDRWPDLTMVNEVSADLRVFLNRGDGSGLFQPFLNPPTPVPVESSPNRPGDFDLDGIADIVTSSNAENRIAIAYGNGDGTFDPPQLINMPSYPRGIAVLDVDGDGDLDLAVANTNANNISLLVNQGGRVFTPAPTFLSGSNGPYGMVAADMNNDGLQDLVVGHSTSQTVNVLRNNGNATFTVVSSRSCGGANWVLWCNDVNNDGFIDVASANSFSANGGMLLGNGNGTLRPVVTYPTSGHTAGTELADFDGDGDQDWILSAFGGGRWHMLRNDGAGAFTAWRTIIAPNNPACSICADFDRDGDVDWALLDEIADVIILYENVNPPPSCDADYDQNGVADQDDVAYLVNVVAGGENPTGRDPDFDQNGVADQDDTLALIDVIAGGDCP